MLRFFSICMLLVCSSFALGKSLNQPQVPWEDQSNSKRDLMQRKWVRKISKSMLEANNKKCQSWALFSYSGWVDQGQWIFIKCEEKIDFFQIPPASLNWSKSHIISKKSFAIFLQKFDNFHKLEDLEQAVFDGINFEYIYLTKAKGAKKVNLIKRIYMNNPQVGSPSKQHLKLIKAFQNFKPEAP